LGNLTQGKPWAKFSWPFGPQTPTLNRYEAWAMFLRPFGPLEMSKPQGPLGRKIDAKHIQGFNPGKHSIKRFALQP
jgi:hypothetical protein